MFFLFLHIKAANKSTGVGLFDNPDREENACSVVYSGAFTGGGS